MSYRPRFQVEIKNKVPADLEELGQAISKLPETHREALLPLYWSVLDAFQLRSRILSIAKSALERIRLEVACLQFDLEATRREKDSLEKQIEED